MSHVLFRGFGGSFLEREGKGGGGGGRAQLNSFMLVVSLGKHHLFCDRDRISICSCASAGTFRKFRFKQVTSNS